MPSISTPANVSVEQAISTYRRQHGTTPVPLAATSYAIAVNGGLADVVAKRTFRNAETQTIEALLTFPVPVAAAVYSLQARIGERTLSAIAKSREEARESYERAVDRGKTAVLHEELFRGVHLLSVAHVAPGTEIEVTMHFALPLSLVRNRAFLRIPTTVGDIYGNSGLPDSDELVHGGPVLSGEVSVTSDCGEAVLLGQTLNEGRAKVALNAPIDVEIRSWQLTPVIGRAADGRRIDMTFSPAPAGEADIDAVVLIDHSGSMGSRCSGGAALTKFEAVLLGLGEVASDLRTTDRLNLWDFDDKARDLGTARGDQWRALLRQLAGPDGGTEIGGAIKAVLATRKTRDIMIVTDGKSYAIPVQELAQSGARFTVVLIGEDSLDANVGYLAALTGGQIFIPPDADVSDAVRSAFAALRQPPAPKSATNVSTVRSGLCISVTYGPATAAGEPEGRACAAHAASLVLPSLPEAEARQLALAEGLVTHLTSLILVDEAGSSQQGLPLTRKVELPSPATAAPAAARMYCNVGAPPAAGYDFMQYERMEAAADEHVARSYRPAAKMRAFGLAKPSAPAAAPAAPVSTSKPSLHKSDRDDHVNLAHLPARIDWRNEGHRLADGNMIGIAPDIADAIDDAARIEAVRRCARRFGLSPRKLVIALLARVASKNDRYADRVARAILVHVKARNATEVADILGLSRRARAAS